MLCHVLVSFVCGTLWRGIVQWRRAALIRKHDQSCGATSIANLCALAFWAQSSVIVVALAVRCALARSMLFWLPYWGCVFLIFQVVAYRRCHRDDPPVGTIQVCVGSPNGQRMAFDVGEPVGIHGAKIEVQAELSMRIFRSVAAIVITSSVWLLRLSCLLLQFVFRI